MKTKDKQAITYNDNTEVELLQITPSAERQRRSTFAVLFYINRTKIRKDGMCQLQCKVSIDAESRQIGTKVSVDPSVWSPTQGVNNNLKVRH